MANPHNGTVVTSYAALGSEMRSRLKVNLINKIFLSLKRKRYLWFPRQQGSRSSFVVEIRKYPLSNKSFKDIVDRFNAVPGRSGSRSARTTQGAYPTENEVERQKLKSDMRGLVQKLSMDRQVGLGRSANNENDNKKYKLSNVQNFRPKSAEESRCKEIAEALGETSIAFIRSTLNEHGISLVERAYAETVEDSRRGAIENKGAYFNAKVRKLTLRVNSEN